VSQSRLPVSLGRTISDLARRVANLERQLRGSTTAYRDHPPLRFVQSGAVTATTSPPAIFPDGADVRTMTVLLGTAGSTATTVQVERNGTSVQSATVAASSTMSLVSVGEDFTPGDRVTVTVTAAGTGAEDLDVQLVYR